MRKIGVKKSAFAVSCIKGLEISDNKPITYTTFISQKLSIPCYSLSGANVAKVFYL